MRSVTVGLVLVLGLVLILGLVLVAGIATAATVIFDDAHKPTNSVLEQNPVCELTSGLRGGYRELAALVGEEGHTVEVLSFPSMFTSEVLQGKCAVVINAPCKFGNCGSSYTVEEIALLYEYLLGGGNLVIMAEPFLRAPLSPLLSRMGMVMGNSIATHQNPATYELTGSNLILDNGNVGSSNFSDHPIFENIAEVVLYGSDFILRNTGVNLIASEEDGTPSAVPLAALYETGDGRAIIIGDSDWLSSKDENHNGVINLLERNNAWLVTNILNLLCPPEKQESYARSIGYWRHQCKGIGHTEVSIDSLAHLQSRIEEESSFFTECYDLSGCDLLLAPPPNNNMLRKAAQQLYGLWLNYESGKFPGSAMNRSGDEATLGSRTDIWRTIQRIEAILCDPSSSLEQLEWAKDLAESINTSGEQIYLLPSARTLKIRPQETSIVALTICNYSNLPYDLTLTTEGDFDAVLDISHIVVQPNQTSEVMLYLRPSLLLEEEMGFAIVKMLNDDRDLIDLCVVGAEIESTAGVDAIGGNQIKLLPSPNPSSGNIEMEIAVTNSTHAHLSIYDPRGRFIRNLINGQVQSGSTRLVWDRKDQNGKDVAPGIYFARLETEGHSRTAKIVLSK